MSDEKKKKVLSIQLVSGLEVGGTTRTFISTEADWAKSFGVELGHAGQMSAVVRWNKKSSNKIERLESLVSCHAINFEPVPQ